MKIIIVASSPFKSFKEKYHLNPSDYFIGIDEGCIELINRNIKPDISIGDFDSTNQLNIIKEKSIETLCYNTKKDETDLELALKHLDKLTGATNLEINIYNATGGRLDHEYNNYMLMAKYQQYKIKLIDLNNEVMFLKKGDCYKINPLTCKYFSIISYDDAIINIKDALYPLENQKLTKKDTFAISNETINNAFSTVEILKGSVFLFITNK